MYGQNSDTSKEKQQRKVQEEKANRVARLCLGNLQNGNFELEKSKKINFNTCTSSLLTFSLKKMKVVYTEDGLKNH